MAVTVIDKIKQKNNGTFKLLDYIDINGRITGWQNPVKAVFADIASITGLSEGDHFIVCDVSATWDVFTGTDIYGATKSKIDNGIYIAGGVTEGAVEEVYLVTEAANGMMCYDENSGNLKRFSGSSWVDFVTGSGISGQSLRYSTEFAVLIGTNYSTTTKQLLIGTALVSGDNVNLYVNGLKYSHIGSYPDFSFTAGQSYLVWSVTNTGFDLVNDDYIEIEIFNNE